MTMKKLYITLLLLLVPCSMLLAQEQIRVWKQGTGTRFTNPEMVFSEDASSFTVADSTYNTSQIDSITVVHTIYVTFNDGTATVDLDHARDITYTTDGAHVNILSTNTKNELEFVLQGQSTQGSLTYEGPLKCKFYLNGLNLKSDRGAAIDIQCGKRIDLILNPGTENFLEDAAGGEQKAAFYCKGHLEVSGSGSLTVTGNARHGIATKEYMQIKRSTGSITVNKAINDALHIGQYFLMNGGTLNISGQGGDGIQVEVKTLDDDITPDPDKEDNGQMFIRGGNISIAVTAICSKGIKAPKDLVVSGGKIGFIERLDANKIKVNEYGIIASGNGSRGIQVSGNMLVNQDTDTTEIAVRATGGVYYYEDEEEEEHDTRCMGIKVGGNMTVNAGTIAVTNVGSGTRAIRIGGTLTTSPEAIVKGSVTYSSGD